MHKDHTIRDLRTMGWRLISNKRARKLRKRGEFVYWNFDHCCWLWESSIIEMDEPRIVNNPAIVGGKSVDRWFIEGHPNSFWQKKEYAEAWLNSR